MLRSGAEVNANSATCGRAIHIAVEFGFVEMVDILLRHGSEVYVDSPKGYPLQIARQGWMQSCTSERQRRFHSVLELLRSAGAAEEETRTAFANTNARHQTLISPGPMAVIGSTEAYMDWS